MELVLELPPPEYTRLQNCLLCLNIDNNITYPYLLTKNVRWSFYASLNTARIIGGMSTEKKIRLRCWDTYLPARMSTVPSRNCG